MRTSRNHLIQFVYGEDGMAGECIEDLSIDLLKSSDAEVTKHCEFPEPGSSEAADRQLNDSISDLVLQ